MKRWTAGRLSCKSWTQRHPLTFVSMHAVDWHLASADAAANVSQHTRTPACLVSGCEERGAASGVKCQQRDPQRLGSSSPAKAVTHQQEDPQEASVCATQGDRQDAPLAIEWRSLLPKAARRLVSTHHPWDSESSCYHEQVQAARAGGPLPWLTSSREDRQPKSRRRRDILSGDSERERLRLE